MKRADMEKAKNQAYEIAGLKKSAGWGIFEEEYLTKRQKTLMAQLIRCKPEDAAVVQGRLKELTAILKWFGVKQQDGIEALKLLTEADQAGID